MKMNMTLQLRQLLLDEGVDELVTEIYARSKNEGTTYVQLRHVSDCLADAYADRTLYEQGPDAYQAQIAKCYNLPEKQFVDFITEKRIIQSAVETDENGNNPVLRINSLNRSEFSALAKWVQESRHLITFGEFSLNPLTGAAYFQDNETIFKSGSGYYELFKSLLTTTAACLTFSEIAALVEHVSIDQIDDGSSKEKAIESIKHLKKHLKLTRDKGSSLLRMYERRGFTLIPHLIQ